MRNQRGWCLGVVYMLCATGVIAGPSSTGSTDSIWDRTYRHDPDPGKTWPCPEPRQDIVVSGGRFSIPWDTITDFQNNDHVVTIAHIEGSVRPSGITTATITFADPLPPKFVEDMQQSGDSLDELRHKQFDVRFEIHSKKRTIVVSDHEQCHTEWDEDLDAAKRPNASGPVDCSSGAYAALWSAKRAYKHDEFARIATPGQPSRVYRCIDACKPGTSPTEGGGDRDDDSAWAFFAECKQPPGQAAAPLAKSGSPAWDAKYGTRTEARSDWRCPTSDPINTFVVSKGRFSIPWNLSTDRADGGHYDDAPIGRIDGVVQADGSVVLRPTFTIDQLPPEVTEIVRDDQGNRDKSRATMEYVRSVMPTMKFTSDGGKMNPHGQGRRVSLLFDGGRMCEYNYEAQNYKTQQFRESDGWRVECNSDQGWSSKVTFQNGDKATVSSGGARHQYECDERPSCTPGSRPGNSSQWRLVGRCQ